MIRFIIFALYIIISEALQINTKGSDQMNESKLCISASEISKKMGLSLSMIRKLTRSGKIPHIKVGRRILYPAYAIDDWLRTHTIQTTAQQNGGING